MSRVRVYDALDIAKDIRETFTAKKAQRIVKFPFDWKPELQHIGDSLAVAYSSDKWKSEGDFVLYKHLAESRNRALSIPGFLHDMSGPSKRWPVIGPMVSFEDVPMPKEFAVLALFEEVNLQLHTKGTDEDPGFGRGDNGVVKVTLSHGMLGGSKILWSKVNSKMKDQPFLVVYTEREGPLMILVGEELDIEADGIVG